MDVLSTQSLSTLPYRYPVAHLHGGSIEQGNEAGLSRGLAPELPGGLKHLLLYKYMHSKIYRSIVAGPVNPSENNHDAQNAPKIYRTLYMISTRLYARLPNACRETEGFEAF